MYAFKLIHWPILILIFLVPMLMISCGAKNDKAFSMNDPGVPIQQLVDSIEKHGNVGAFYSLQTASLDYHPGEFLLTFQVMADKYNNADACMEVYYQLVHMNNVPLIDESENGIYKLDSLAGETREMAIRYLLKADSLGNPQAKEQLAEYRQLGLIK
jgi:hypothetical protein